MRVLIIKTSSLGDLIHTFPALTDAAKRNADIEFHWLVEEAFQEVPQWHPAVKKVLAIALRRWRRHWRKTWRSGELGRFRAALRASSYDLVIDAQGLLKSALPARLAGAPVAGYDRRSIREPAAALFYQRRFAVSRQLHAVERIRRLFAMALDYPLPVTEADYALRGKPHSRQQAVTFLHGTTWPSKHWPDAYWAELSALAGADGFEVLWPWHEPEERLRVERIMKQTGIGTLLPRQDLTAMRDQLASVRGVVGVDTGLAHLAAAVGTPAVTLYGPTEPGLTGAVGSRQRNLAADFPCAPCLSRTCNYSDEWPVDPPCFQSLPPSRIWQALKRQMAS